MNDADDPGARLIAIREEMALLAHDQWSGWMRYLFGKSHFNDDGTVTIPLWAVERWQRQMNTDYANLSETEKDSDRQEADRMITRFLKAKIHTCGTEAE